MSTYIPLSHESYGDPGLVDTAELTCLAASYLGSDKRVSREVQSDGTEVLTLSSLTRQPYQHVTLSSKTTWEGLTTYEWTEQVGLGSLFAGNATSRVIRWGSDATKPSSATEINIDGPGVVLERTCTPNDIQQVLAGVTERFGYVSKPPLLRSLFSRIQRSAQQTVKYEKPGLSPSENVRLATLALNGIFESNPDLVDTSYAGSPVQTLAISVLSPGGTSDKAAHRLFPDVFTPVGNFFLTRKRVPRVLPDLRVDEYRSLPQHGADSLYNYFDYSINVAATAGWPGSNIQWSEAGSAFHGTENSAEEGTWYKTPLNPYESQRIRICLEGIKRYGGKDAKTLKTEEQIQGIISMLNLGQTKEWL